MIEMHDWRVSDRHEPILIRAQTLGVESNSNVDVGAESVGEHVAALALLL